MSLSQKLILFASVVAISGIGCGGTSDKTSGSSKPQFNVGSGGTGGNVDVALQPDGTLLIKGTIRDFHNKFPDMEPCSNNSAKSCDSEHREQHPGCEQTGQCIVGKTLLPDGTPQYTGPSGGTLTTNGPSYFNDWFHDTTNNRSEQLTLQLSRTASGTYSYQNLAFFPIDGLLFGNEGADGNGVSHNFNFTTEFHLMFTYATGQTFRFRGDDDLWVFVDGNLVIDLGGIHGGQDATLELDTLDLSAGTDHSFDIFYCERHVVASELEIETSIQFSGSVVVN
jgi:fibro-slime domain-containing protein